MKKGKVYLVGAGPGDPGLLTLKAKRVLSEADLIIYDYLTNPAHLHHAKPSAVTAGVGKGFRHKKPSQKKINQWIIRSAKEGKTVVRLKGGDPYLFGRGGEEAMFLKQQGIAFEVVPGVTSAVACAAYAGIPLTHREHNASVTFLTGHRADDDKLDSIDWKTIASLGGSIVIYMGFYNLGIIASKLMAAGMPAKTKTCVIQWGTLPRQRSCDGALGDIEGKVKKMKMGAPCIIIIGDVVAMRKDLDWFEKLPLFGKKIVITRTRDKAGSLGAELEALGADVLEFPTIEIKPLSSYKALDAEIKNIHHYNWLFFASPYGVAAFFERLYSHGRDSRSVASVKIASVGAGTSRELRLFGLRPDLEPEEFHTEKLADEFQKRRIDLHNVKMLSVRADIAPDALDKRLTMMGAKVTRVDGYRTRKSAGAPHEVRQALLEGRVDYAVFTSSSTFENFVSLLGALQVRKTAAKTRFISIGPVTSATMRHLGFKPYLEAKEHSIQGLVSALGGLK